ncbi:2'-5' RNA ligase superfamily-domain-containing protein [Chaetomium strumarium]|uniref:polynucleotide adenylyltransferase n=1 Tax=Chaetomium strumarium TaxID=1170767 RepID=A0AAJ0GV61_9PEZI|nr:2'-5' RNA ligase superfamily-domain-containing protein [Chaetomium strumarium]
MAQPSEQAAASRTAFSLNSHDTALALIPPRHLWPRIDRLRALYDKAYPRWPPHINLVYPFVRPEALADAVDRIASALAGSRSGKEAVKVCLDRAGIFHHPKKGSNTIYLGSDGAEEEEGLCRLRKEMIGSLGVVDADTGYTAHLTVAQSEDANSSAHKFLVEKVRSVPKVNWTAAELAVLVRERTGHGQSVMRLWGAIVLADGSVEKGVGLGTFYEQSGVKREDGEEGEEEENEGVAEKDQLQSGLASYYFDEETLRWMPFRPSTLDADEEERKTLAVASYNVLAEFHWPPSETRYPLLVKNILAESAAADVLVLQEVTDGFLSYLLADDGIRDAYPYCSHGPPDQDDIEPLPDYLNIVVLSKMAFDWEYVSFHRKHKGAVVARFAALGRSEGAKIPPVILAAIHLSHGLTDGAVAAKKADIKRITGYLSQTYPGHPWILAGDFNVATSCATVAAALKKKAISELTVSHLSGLDKLFAEAKLDDAWAAAAPAEGRDSSADVDDGERGATWDPTVNGAAAAMAGSNGYMRPQRYDRILVRGEGLFEISKFNMFGSLTEKLDDAGSEVFASDHWGIRCTMDIRSLGGNVCEPSEEIAGLVVPVQLQRAPEHLAGAGSLAQSLGELGVIPGVEEIAKRKEALNLLRDVILDTPTPYTAAETRSQPTVVVVPVGSYALDVWTSSSDMDVLCIGPFSSNTFFALASQRLRRAAAQGSKIRMLRRVRANTGTMLEIEVHGIKVDLQYCPAATVAERWPDVLRAPPSDPVWSLSAQTLSKLKAIRDIDYLRRSVPDLATFRAAHRAIKTWARSRGLYSARFGFLSGIQISILLARVHKLITRDESGACSAEDLVATFFAHYAVFPWASKPAFDPFFHRHHLAYTRSPREPLAILGFFPPSLNTAVAASMPSTKALAHELRLAADALLSPSSSSSSSSSPCPCPSWSTFLSSPTATHNFLTAHRSYIRIDIQYWGLSLGRGAQLLGWLESRCVGLLVDLHRRAPGLDARMWPARGCYLIGLAKADPDMGKEELQLALGALQGVLARFETQMRADERYFDARSCWLSAAVVNKGELGELEVDQREWGEYTPGEEEEEEEDEEEEAGAGAEAGKELGQGSAAEGSEEDESWPKRDKGKKKGAAGRRQIATVDLRADKTKRFRTAADVMNRIRWDPQLDSSDYVIGYEDRFAGAQEKALEAWKSEQTDEEFIPQHRILYFRRKSDGRKIWDRRTRWDELFGGNAA